MRKIIFCLFSCAIIMNFAYSQEEALSSKIQIGEHIPAPPNTAGLSKYFDVPVNMATGVPDIKLPIYTVNAGRISLPIYLSYHSGSNKVNNAASWVGFGWDLICGGAIVKQVNGLDDLMGKEQYPTQAGVSNPALYEYMENPNYSYDANDNALGFVDMTSIVDSMKIGQRAHYPTWMDSVYRLLGKVILGKYDGESDEYHFRAPIGNGKIFYNQKTGSFEADEINGWKLWYDFNNDKWVITAKNGLEFTYGMQESSFSPFYSWPLSGNPSSQQIFTSAWYLTKIFDPSTGKEVELEYDLSPMVQQMYYVAHSQDWQTSSGPPSLQKNSPRLIERYANQVSIRKIVFPEGIIEFTKDTLSRIDHGEKPLREISIFDNGGRLVKRFQLDYFYAWRSSVNTTKLFLHSLKEIRFIKDAPEAIPPYVITYDTSQVMPPRFSYGQDIYGFNNGVTTNTTDIPTTIDMTMLGIPAHANRDIDTLYTQTGIIKGIKYPTGGTISFEFENNRIGDTTLVGGLRIKRIRNYDSLTNKELVTGYKYERPNGISSGIVHNMPTFHYGVEIADMGMVHTRISGDPVYPLFANQGSPVTYEIVEKLELSAVDTLLSRHYFSTGPTFVDQAVDWTYRNSSPGVPFNKYSDLQKFSFHPYKEEYFKFMSGQGYKLIKRVQYEYDYLDSLKNYIWNVQTAWGKSNWGGFTEWSGFDPYTRVPMDPIPYVNAYLLVQDNLINTLSHVEEFDDLDSVMLQRTFKVYDTANGNLKQISNVNSKGDTLRTYFVYSSDLAYTSSIDSFNVQINSLLDHNYLDAPIEVLSTLQKPGGIETLVSARLYLYKNKVLAKVLSIDQSISMSSFVGVHNDNAGFYFDPHYLAESEVEIINGFGKPLQIRTREKVQSFIWDNENLLATVENAQVAAIARSSFESVEQGNWNYSGSVIKDNTTVSGSYVYDLGTGNMTNTGSIPNGIYIVSYWSKSGSKSVNGATTSGSASVNGWTLFKHLVTVSSGNISISGSGLIDEVRLYPVGSMMTSFVHKPLVGISDLCDVNDRFNYYRYDDFGRLALIVDADGHIIKKVCYNYAGQPEACTVYYSVADSASFIRNNCGTGYTGGSVTYVVPAGKYTSYSSQSDANAQAQADIDANGQAYANANGTCTQSIYAKLTYENYNYSYSNAVHADVVVRFYSDASCTTPLSVSNLTIQLSTEGFDGNDIFSYDYPETVSGTYFVVEANAELSYDDGMTYRFKDYYLLSGTGYTVVW